MWTVDEIQEQISSEIDQSSVAPTTSDTDWSIRLNLINRSLKDWADSYEWESLKKIYNGRISTSTGNASVSLPSNFKKIDGYVRIPDYDLQIVNPTENLLYTDTDKYANVLGNEVDGKTLHINAGTLASGASIQFTYYAFPASLTTTTQVSEIPDPTYLVQRTLYYLYKGREDGRFPEAKVESDRILARMIENENTKGWGEKDRRVHVYSHPFRDFRVGRD